MTKRRTPRGAITVTRSVGVDTDRLWSVISAPGYLEDCHPFCEANPVESWPGEGAADTIRYYGGHVVRRSFTGWQEGVGYDIDVTDDSGRLQARVRWRIEPDGRSASRLTLTLLPMFFSQLPLVLRWAPAAFIRYRMRGYLEAVVAGIAFFAEAGERVTRNQFGAHSWFSPIV